MPTRRRIAATDQVVIIPGSDLLLRFKRACARGIRLLMRQSSPTQARYARGSGLVQELANHWVARYGEDPAAVIPVDARGESWRRGNERKVFKGLVDAAEAKQFAVLILPVFDRVGRHMATSCGLFDALADVGGFILTENRLFDLKNPDDMADAREKANEAERQNEARRAQAIECRKALANQCALRTGLPVGQVWAVPGESYCGALKATEQTDLVDLIMHHRDRWEAWCNTPDGVMLPLWYPDRDVIHACRLRIDWLLETGSLTAVLDRIRESEEWPRGHAGLVPILYSWRWHPDMTTLWLSPYRDGVRRWLGNPSIYGIYSFKTGADSGNNDRTNPERATVFERDVFPAYGTSDEFDEARRILLAPDPLNKLPRYRSGTTVCAVSLGAGPRNLDQSADELGTVVLDPANTPTARMASEHARARRRVAIFDDNRCGHPISASEVCGHRLERLADGDRPDRNYSVLAVYACLGPGHTTMIPYQSYRSTLCDVVAQSLELSDIGATFDRLTLARSASGQELQRRRREEARLNALATAAGHSEDAARADGDVDAVERARTRQRQYAADRDRLARRLAALETEIGASEAELQLDLEQVKKAVRTARELLTPSDAPADLVHRVVTACVSRVWVRNIGVGAQEMDVEFKTGVTVRRHIASTAPPFPQPVWAYAYASTRDAATRCSPDEIAGTIAALREIRDLGACTTGGCTVFRAANVPACVAAYRAWHSASPVWTSAWTAAPALRPRLGPGWSASQLAAFTGDDTQRLLAVGMIGQFGPAYVSDDGDIIFVPSLRELHLVSKSYAARTVECEAGWEPGSAISVRTLGRILPGESSTFRLWHMGDRRLSGCDAMGRRYVRRDGVFASHLARFMEAAARTNPEFAALPLENWLSLRVACSKLRLPAEMILTVAPTVSYTYNARAKDTVYVWTGSAVRAELCRRVLATAARDHGVSAGEFHTASAIRARFGRLGVSFHNGRTNGRRFQGVVVIAPIEHRRVARGRYFCVPTDIWMSEDPVVVLSWVEQHGHPKRKKRTSPSNVGDPLIS